MFQGPDSPAQPPPVLTTLCESTVLCQSPCKNTVLHFSLSLVGFKDQLVCESTLMEIANLMGYENDENNTHSVHSSWFSDLEYLSEPLLLGEEPPVSQGFRSHLRQPFDN